MQGAVLLDHLKQWGEGGLSCDYCSMEITVCSKGERGEGVGRSTNRLAFVSAFSSVPSTFSERSGEWSSTLSYFMYT